MSEAFEKANGFLSKRELHGGHKWTFRFQNDFGASVIRHSFSYGHEDGRFELAVLRFRSDNESDSMIIYTTPITNNVLGCLSEEDVLSTLERIAALEAV